MTKTNLNVTEKQGKIIGNIGILCYQDKDFCTKCSMILIAMITTINEVGEVKEIANNIANIFKGGLFISKYQPFNLLIEQFINNCTVPEPKKFLRNMYWTMRSVMEYHRDNELDEI